VFHGRIVGQRDLSRRDDTTGKARRLGSCAEPQERRFHGFPPSYVTLISEARRTQHKSTDEQSDDAREQISYLARDIQAGADSRSTSRVLYRATIENRFKASRDCSAG
jgi:hypothetical protein